MINFLEGRESVAGRFGSPVAGVSDGPGTGRRAVLAVSRGGCACVRACGSRAARGAGLRGRGGRPAERASAACSCGGGRKGAVAVGGGRVAAARGELLGRSGLGDCVLPLLQWAAAKLLAQSARAGAPNFRLFLFWPEPRFLSLHDQPVALRYSPSPRCCPAASQGPGSEALASLGRSSRSSDPGVQEGDEKLVLKNFLTEFTLRYSPLQGSREDELPGLGKFLLTCHLDLKPCATVA